MKHLFPFVFAVLLLLTACTKEIVRTKNDFNTGKNRFTTKIDGDEREYYVHVPTHYDAKTPTPVVLMLHGTSGDGEKFYNISGWKEVGEKENILTVFPSSWHHCIIENGQTLNTTKWNIYPGSFEYCTGEKPRDDVKFLRQVITEMKQKFNVDNKRVYLVGFSNGGQMAFRCGVEMSDILAAVIENAASTATDTTAIPKRNLPIAFQLGNEDDRYFSSPAPLSSFTTGLNQIDIFKRIVHSHTSTFHYKEQFTMSGDTNTAVIATYPPDPSGENRIFNMVFVKDLGHEYPNGINHWMNGAQQHWEWLKKFTLP